MSSSMMIHIPCAGKERLPMLWATLASLAAAGLPEDVAISVSYNSGDQAYLDVNDGAGLRTWQALFGPDRFKIVDRPGLPVATMYVYAAIDAAQHDFAFMLKVDDDCLFTNLADFIDFVYSELPTYATFNFWDITNHRKYDDWRSSVDLEDYDDMVRLYGERTTWCHRWNSAPPLAYHIYSNELAINASMFSVHLKTFLGHHELVSSMLAFKRGQRGMDLCMSSGIGGTRVHHFAAYATHLGVFRPQLDGKYWTEFVSPEAEINHSGNIR